MPRCDKYHAKWKADMATCSKYHAKCKVTMPKCSKYHAKWQVLVQNCCKIQGKWYCCKYKANTRQIQGKWCQKKTRGKKNNNYYYSTPFCPSQLFWQEIWWNPRSPLKSRCWGHQLPVHDGDVIARSPLVVPMSPYIVLKHILWMLVVWNHGILWLVIQLGIS